MFIRVWCRRCFWEGYAEVGDVPSFGRWQHRSIKDYECPKCGNTVKRPRKGRRDLTKDSAKLKG